MIAQRGAFAADYCQGEVGEGNQTDSGQFLKGTRLIGAASPQVGALIEINDLCHLQRENRARPAVQTHAAVSVINPNQSLTEVSAWLKGQC